MRFFTSTSIALSLGVGALAQGAASAAQKVAAIKQATTQTAVLDILSKDSDVSFHGLSFGLAFFCYILIMSRLNTTHSVCVRLQQRVCYQGRRG